MVRWVSRNLGHKKPPVRVLDLGCGQGAATWFLAREGFDVVAVDGSISALQKARSRLLAEDLQADYAACCFSQLPFCDMYFDAVVDVVSSAHNHNTELIFNEVRRVLKPGGLFYTQVPTSKATRCVFSEYGTIRFFDRDELRQLLSGFTCSEILNSSYQLDDERTVDLWCASSIK